MKLQPESKKELLRIAGGTAFCTAIMWVLFAALHLVGWVKFDDNIVRRDGMTVAHVAQECVFLAASRISFFFYLFIDCCRML